MFRAMAEGRERSRAKQARRDARRSKARRRETVDREVAQDAPLIDEVRHALDGGRPLDLLGLVSTLIVATAPRQAVLLQAEEDRPPSLEQLVTAFIEMRAPETTALLAVLGELVVGDDALRTRCRREVGERDDDLPRWLSALAETRVEEVVRMMHVLGDGEDLLLGVRLADGSPLTCVTHVDHLTTSEINDAFFLPEAVDAVLSVAEANNTDPDTSFVAVDLGAAKAQLQLALDAPLSMLPLEESDTWPSCSALVRWLIHLMPSGGSSVAVQQRDSHDAADVLERFLDSAEGRPYRRDHRALLQEIIDEGTGDPVRWSAARLRQLLDASLGHDDVPVAVRLDVPELLRVFVPFAHAESGIREGLTAEALAAIDESAAQYKAIVLEEAQHRHDDPDA
jgi:hypothetical protein